MSIEKSMDDFVSYLALERGYSPNTVRAYSSDLAKLLEYARSRSVPADSGAIQRPERLPLPERSPSSWASSYGSAVADDHTPVHSTLREASWP